MIIPILTSNAQLFDYLCDLARELQRCNETEAADAIVAASKFISGSPSEFLHESRVALVKVQSTCRESLSSFLLEGVSSVVNQIDDAFRRIGGA
jgi:tellurite resistance protein